MVYKEGGYIIPIVIRARWTSTKTVTKVMTLSTKKRSIKWTPVMICTYSLVSGVENKEGVKVSKSV